MLIISNLVDANQQPSYFKSVLCLFLACHFMTLSHAADFLDFGLHRETVNQVIDIDEAMRRGVAFQPRLAIEDANVKKKEILNNVEKYNWHPSVDIDVIERLDARTDNRTSASSEGVRVLRLTATQDLNIFRQKLQRNISEKSLGVSLLQKDAQINNVAEGIAILYLEALRFKQLHQVAVERQELYQQFERVIEKRKILGVASELESTRIEVSIKRGKSEESFLKRRLQDALSILSDNIGLTRIEKDYLLLPDVRSEMSEAGPARSIFNAIMSNNLTLRVAEENLRLAELNYKNSQWEKYPTVSLLLSQDYKKYREGGSKGNRILEAKLSMPLWDGFKRTGNINIAAAEIEISKAQIADHKLLLITRYHELNGTFKTALDEYNYALLAKKEAERLIALQRISFAESDETSVVEAISGVSEWSTSLEREANSLIDVLQAQYQILTLANTLR